MSRQKNARQRRSPRESVLSRQPTRSTREGVNARIGWRATRCDLVSPMWATTKPKKPPVCSDFFKPSDGLEPSTPSLPWRIRTLREDLRNGAGYRAFPAAKRLLVLGSPPPRRPLSILEKPRTCPQNLSPETSSVSAPPGSTRGAREVGGPVLHQVAEATACRGSHRPTEEPPRRT